MRPLTVSQLNAVTSATLVTVITRLSTLAYAESCSAWWTYAEAERGGFKLVTAVHVLAVGHLGRQEHRLQADGLSFERLLLPAPENHVGALEVWTNKLLQLHSQMKLDHPKLGICTT